MSSPSASTSVSRKEQQRLDRRRYVIEAAEEVFARRGFHETSMEEIAKTAEYATGTVYLYFKSKEDLFVAILEEKMRELVASVKERTGAQKDPLETLRQVIQAQLEYFDRNRTFFQIFVNTDMSCQAESTKSEQWQKIRELYLEFIQYVETGVKHGQRKGVFRAGEPGLYALAILGALNMIVRFLLEHGSGKFADQTDFIVNLALNGIAK